MDNTGRALPPFEAEAIVKFYNAGLSIKEIARRIRRGEKTVSKYVRKAGILRWKQPPVKVASNGQPVTPPVHVPSAIDSRIYLVGFSGMPEWAAPYVEANRIYMVQP